MNRPARSGAFAALFSGLKSALQWHLLLWWVVALWLPTLLFALPLWRGLQAQFGFSAHAAQIAAGNDPLLLVSGLGALSESNGPALASGSLFALVLTALLAPWLTGMTVAAIRAGRRLGLGELAHGGLAEYWRMLRLLLWALLPLGIAVAIGAALLGFASSQAETAILESDIAPTRYFALAVLALLFVFAHATVEAARGWFGAEPGLRSIFRAWWRGTKLVLRRPLASLIVYLGCGLAGYVLAALLGYGRLHMDGAGFGRFLAGMLLTQLVVIALAWGRIARLYGFAALARGRIADIAAKAAAEPAIEAVEPVVEETAPDAQPGAAPASI